MAEPTSAYSIQALILRVAKAAGIAYYGSDGQGVAMVPVNEHDLQRCLDIVNDGIKFFIASAPPEGWRWMDREMTITFAPSVTGTADAADATSITDTDLATDYDDDYWNGYVLKVTGGTGEDETATITDYDGTTGKFTFSAGLSGSTTPDTTTEYRICPSTSVVDSDPARYQLADDFQGEVAGEITYEADSGRGTCLDWVSEAEIRRCREVDILTGYPNKAAVRPYSGRRWEILFDPEPTAADTVTFRYKAGFAAMQAKGGEASAGDATSLTDSSIANLYPDDYFNDWTIYIIGGTGRNSYATVTDYTGATGAFTVADWLSCDGSAGGTDPDATSEYFVTDGTTHPAGMQFDEAILGACLAKAELGFEDLQVGYMNKFLELDLKNAWMLDARSAPKKLGCMLPGTQRTHRYPDDHNWNDVIVE